MLRIRQNIEQIRGARRRLQDYLRRLKRNSDAQKRLAKEFQQEREGRRQAESRLRQHQNRAAPPTVTNQTYALPEPDESLGKPKIFRSLISPLKPGKMLDLGAGKGNFSLIAAQLGWEATAVDARTVRFPDPEAEKNPKHAKLIPSVKWIQADVREFPIRRGEYDLICILGLLHRLGLDDQIKLLRRCSDTLTLLDVRVAPRIVATEGPYEGKYHHQGGETREERDQIPQTAWGNEFGFRHTEDSLLRLVRDCGYGTVMLGRPPHKENYTFYLCLPPL